MARDHYQTVKEVADRLKVGEATVRHWIREGDLRAIDIGKGWRIADTDLDAFLRAHATRARDDTTASPPDTAGPATHRTLEGAPPGPSSPSASSAQDREP
ncbi:helix-turn-helix domain-containing protein [Stappia sp.]|uniref:helix-turn-helix domain-containing protein n=1 Tax=Stappia sp. TaxID=1870903 RepID=UPI0032D9A948